MGVSTPPPPGGNIPLPPAAHPPILASTYSQGAITGKKKTGQDTIKTSPQGDLEQPATAKATLLGG